MCMRPRSPSLVRVDGFHVVICGGGVAAVEGLLRLRSLVDDRVEVTLVAPNDDFVYRPIAVREATGFGWTRRYQLWDLTRDAGAEWVHDAVASVDCARRRVETVEGLELRYDALLVAVGGRQVADLDHALTFRDAEANRVYETVVKGVERAELDSVAFVVPEGPVYPLPVYELALLTAERARRAGIGGVELVLVTPEPFPLAAFGGAAGAVVGGRLREAGVEIYASANAFAPEPGRLLVQPQGADLSPDRIVAMPRLAGPGIRGLVGHQHGFIPVDAYCGVPGTDGRVFAAGDATAFPIKHGGLAAQQADTAAAAIAQLAGAGVEPAPFSPQLRGKLLTGGKPLYLSARLVGTQGFESEVSETPPWPVDDKIVAAELGPYLAGLDHR
jgi:sulfide:quinone oxidoreductase